MRKAINRINKYCAYFPCHEQLEDCTFCYCPLYPCENKQRGRYVITKDNRKAWSCEECNWIHQRSVVDRIFSAIKNSNFNAQRIRERFKDKDIGVIILGHGSRLKSANDTVRNVAKEIKARSGLGVVEPAYLQLSSPDLAQAMKKAAKAGCGVVVIVPFFIFTGNHVKRDIPAAISCQAKIYKGVKLIYAKNLGQDARINDIVMDCIIEALR